MRCGVCGDALERPGDYCLQCDTQNCTAVYVEASESTADIHFLSENTVHGKQHIRWRKDDTSTRNKKLERNFVGRIVDITRRKKPTYLYLNTEPDRIRKLRSQVHEMEIFTFQSIENPVEQIQSHMATNGLETVDMQPEDKIGGSHSTVIGDRQGHAVLTTVATSRFVKKVIPGPIDGGGNSGGGFRAEVTRADNSGNLRVLVKEGGTVQTVRVVTTAAGIQDATKVKNELETLLTD